MSKLRLALCLIVLLAVAAGCGGGEFAKEKTVLESVAQAMTTFADGVGAGDTPDALAGVLSTFADKLEKYQPQMKAMAVEHPEWQTNPPEELVDSFAKFQEASQKFQGAMPKLMQFAGEHGDNPTLKAALEKFQGVVTLL